jgi:hypothetical protein
MEKGVMKKILMLSFTVTVVLLGVLCITQSRRLSRHKEELATLNGELEQQVRQAAESQATNQRLKRERRQLLDQVNLNEQNHQLAASTPPATAPGEAPSPLESEKSDQHTGAMGKLLAKMMQDPDTRKFIRDQQRQMMDSLYNPLIKHMGLAPEDAELLKDFITESQMNSAEMAGSMFGGGSTNRTEVLNKLTAEQKETDGQIQAFLGGARYAQYKEYQQTLGERMQLNQFKVQTASDPNPLTDMQAEQLLAIMSEEKQGVAAATGQPLSGLGQDPTSAQAFLSEEQMEKLLESQGIVNQRVNERARTVLSADQWESFSRYQTNQIEMMRMGIRMARKFLAPDRPLRGATQPSQ